MPGILNLPVIDVDTREGIVAEFTREGASWSAKLIEFRDRLVSTNPELATHMEFLASKFPAEVHESLFIVALGSLAIVDRQMETDSMNEIFQHD